MTLTLYSKPNCPACDMLKRRLTRQEIEFETIDVLADSVALARIANKNFRSVPVLEFENEFASGSHLGNPELLAMIASAKQYQNSNNLRM